MPYNKLPPNQGLKTASIHDRSLADGSVGSGNHLVRRPLNSTGLSGRLAGGWLVFQGPPPMSAHWLAGVIGPQDFLQQAGPGSERTGGRGRGL